MTFPVFSLLVVVGSVPVVTAEAVEVQHLLAVAPVWPAEALLLQLGISQKHVLTVKPAWCF